MLYLDCFAGIAGDMFIGALLDLLPDHEAFRLEMSRFATLREGDFQLVIEPRVKNGIKGIHFDVLTHEHHPHRGLHDIEHILTQTPLPDRVRQETLRAFSLLAEAEAAVHGTSPDEIHFHEVGAIDSIVDITGAFVLMHLLGWPQVVSSPLNVGSGTVQCAHGILPVPAPATARLLEGIPVFSEGSPMERTTPTGALLVKSLASSFAPLPAGRIVATGYGLGNRETDDIPNVLRVIRLEGASAGTLPDKTTEGQGLVHEQLVLLECNIDDMNPQDFEPVSEHLFRAGALDVWTEAITMKKGRPAVRFCCLTSPDLAEALTLVILKETTSQGVRRLAVDRCRLRWRIDKLSTLLGELHVKTALLGDTPLRRTPEYEDLKRLAAEHGLPMAEIRRRIALELYS